MSDLAAQKRAATKAERAVIQWLRGEVDHVQCVTTPDGHRHVMKWERCNNDTEGNVTSTRDHSQTND